MELSAGHALEMTVPKELREKHPEIRAIIGGKLHPHLAKWTHPLVADALVQASLARLEKDPNLQSISLAPDDGATWDESEDSNFDAGDFDPNGVDLRFFGRFHAFGGDPFGATRSRVFELGIF